MLGEARAVIVMGVALGTVGDVPGKMPVVSGSGGGEDGDGDGGRGRNGGVNGVVGRRQGGRG